MERSVNDGRSGVQLASADVCDSEFLAEVARGAPVDLLPLWRGEFSCWVRLCSAARWRWADEASLAGYQA